MRARDKEYRADMEKKVRYPTRREAWVLRDAFYQPVGVTHGWNPAGAGRSFEGLATLSASRMNPRKSTQPREITQT
jgi:hypothetical protein